MPFLHWTFLVLIVQQYVLVAFSGALQTVTPLSLSAYKKAEVTIALQNHFRSGLVFLLQNEESLKSKTAQTMTLEVMKFLTSRNIPTAVLLSSSRLMPVQANFCNPLRVLLSTDSHLYKMFENYKLKGVIWLAFLEADQTVEQLLGNTYMRYDILFLVAKYDGTDVHIYEVYHVKHGGPLYIQKFGVYRDKLITTVFDSMYMRRQSLGGHIIKTVGINEYPVVTVPVPQGNKIGGFYGKVWEVLQKSLNFSIDVIVTEDNKWGSVVIGANGSWTGAMGFLVRHEAEAGVCGLAMTGVRAEVVSFTIPIAIFHDWMLIQAEDTKIQSSWKNYFRIFSLTLWFTIAIFIVIIAIIFKVCYHIGSLHGIEETTIEIPIREAIFNVLGAICQQGQASTPLSANCRFVFIMSYILSLVLVCAYSATVISFLTVKDVNLPFSNLEELYMDDDFRLGVLNASAKFMKFQNAKTGILKDVYTKKLKPEELQLPNTVHEGLIKICSTKKYSFLTPLEKATVFFNKVPCHIFTIPYDISVLPMSIAFVKNSSFIGLFQYNLQRLRETGILRKLHIQELYSALNPSQEAVDLRSVTVYDIVPVITLLFGGCLISIFLCIIEKIYHVTFTIKKENIFSLILSQEPIKNQKIKFLSSSMDHISPDYTNQDWKRKISWKVRKFKVKK